MEFKLIPLGCPVESYEIMMKSFATRKEHEMTLFKFFEEAAGKLSVMLHARIVSLKRR